MYTILLIILIIIIFFLNHNKINNLLNFNKIETFIDHIDVDDLQYIPKTNNTTNMNNNYYINVVPEIEKTPGFLSDIYDHMGITSHHYLFSSPHSDEQYNFNKNITAFYGVSNDTETNAYGRPITYPDENAKHKFLENEQEIDRYYINEPIQYRHPEYLENKIVYDYSNSHDFEEELRERELKLRGFKRSSLTEEDDFLSMTFCTDIDELGTDFPCHKYGKEFNYDLANKLKLAKYRNPKTHTGKFIDEDNEYSSNICCK